MKKFWKKLQDMGKERENVSVKTKKIGKYKLILIMVHESTSFYWLESVLKVGKQPIPGKTKP